MSEFLATSHFLHIFQVRTQAAVSCVTVASDLCLHLAGATALCDAAPFGPGLKVLARNVLDALLPFIISPVGTCRALAQVALYSAVFHLYPCLKGLLSSEPKTGADSAETSLSRPLQILGRNSTAFEPEAVALAPFVRMILNNPDSLEMVTRQRQNLLRLNPSTTLTLRALLCSPVTDQGELVPLEVLQDMQSALLEQSVRLHDDDRIGAPESEWLSKEVNWAICAGVLPRRAAFDESLRENFRMTPHTVKSGVTLVETTTFQRKVLSAAASSEEFARLLDSCKTQSANETPMAFDLTAGFSPHGLSPILTQRSEAGRPCQPFIVLASLVDRIPNLAGLARTCEIFAGECISAQHV